MKKQAYLQLRVLDKPIPITQEQADDLISDSYGGSLLTEMRNAFIRYHPVDVLLSHPMSPPHGKVYLESK